MLETMEPYTHVPLGPRLQGLSNLLSQRLSRAVAPKIRLYAKLATVQPKMIYVVAGGVEIRVQVDGALSAHLTE
jgi:hypothetical protein